MSEERKSPNMFGWMLGASIVSIFILLQVTQNVLIIGVAMLLVFYVVLPVPFVRYHFKKRGVKLSQVFFFRGTLRWLLPVLGLTVLVTSFSVSIYWLQLRGLMSIAPTAVELALMPQPFPDTLWYLVATGFILAVIAPIAEEFVFRGLILNWLVAGFGFWKGIGLSSLIFGIFHINFFGAFLFAVMASLLYLKTGNLLVPILLHSANNFVAVYQSFVNPSFPQWLMISSINDLYAKSVPNLIVLAGSLTLLLFIIAWLARGLEDKIEETRVF
ncbi:membrane protease YdiL (CAAX protease family) [Planomicrobium stackebrandtii]|uniref:Membrane protease YdiL (CAAX protease family) n=1 Tax=Planomicrobium stackebrandtii TaxID=253160 RepID=A0ABU0GVH6_9BACL|nr:type II CAAX endopeptidase family protein [Planomicrobium stackebrandtii]MDQ0428575.1 membrane protease YdiL (CAAX protease family) [Planomicrobium stackebrandtii]